MSKHEGVPEPIDSAEGQEKIIEEVAAEEDKERGEYGYVSPKTGIVHYFKTAKEKADFIEEENKRENS